MSEKYNLNKIRRIKVSCSKSEIEKIKLITGEFNDNIDKQLIIWQVYLDIRKKSRLKNVIIASILYINILSLFLGLYNKEEIYKMQFLAFYIVFPLTLILISYFIPFTSTYINKLKKIFEEN